MFEIQPRKARKSASLISALNRVETATLGHILTDGFMSPSLQRIFGNERICGPALTVSVPPDDGAILAHAVSLAEPGDIIVIDRQGDERHACWGSVMTAAAQARGIVGAVIDGFITDAEAISASGFPVWCRGRSPLTTKLIGRGGTIHADIHCGNVLVRSGDLVLADESGVCVLALDELAPIVETALAMQAAEPGIISRVRAGEKIDDINGARALIALAMAAANGANPKG